jgi:hypothetical protein
VCIIPTAYSLFLGDPVYIFIYENSTSQYAYVTHANMHTCTPAHMYTCLALRMHTSHMHTWTHAHLHRAPDDDSIVSDNALKIRTKFDKHMPEGRASGHIIITHTKVNTQTHTQHTHTHQNKKKQVTKKTVETIMSKFCPFAVRLILPGLYESARHEKTTVREEALKVFNLLSKGRAAESLAQEMYDILPVLTELMWDSDVSMNIWRCCMMSVLVV